MTAQEELARRIERDSICRAVQKKIDEGKADFSDTARYNDRAAELLGEVLAAYVPDMPPEERETLCKGLLRQRYTDTNAMLNAVQRTLDAAQGLHLAPQIADYPEERVDQAAHALADETVPVETIVRRAKSAPATIARSFQDDYIEKNAAFRDSAGLKCYITRIAAGGCCKWCTAMAGRFEYGEEPDDIYRRHDNCSCTVTYENGRKRQDVWSKRTWEVPGKNAGASKPTVFSQEQAKTLQDENGLTKMRGSGTMKAITVDDFELRTYKKGIFKEVEKAIFSGIQTAEKRSGAIVSDILISHIPPTKSGREAILTEMMPNGLLRMTFNEDIFAGLSLDEIDSIFSGTESILANSLAEAIIHESGHMKYMKGKKPAEVNKIHSELAKEHIKGISKYAETDGAECIAEVEIMLYRGDDVPEDAMKLYRKYIEGV